MKKYLILACAALVAFAACNKETEIQDPINNTDEVVLTFTSERPQLEAGTKTAWDATNSCIVWESTDKIRVGYTLNGDWMGQTEAGTAKFYASKEVTIDDTDSSVGTFQVPITGTGVTAFTDPETNGTYKFYAIYPSTLLSNTTVNNPTSQSVTLSTAQTPGDNTFDPSTDIMVGVTDGMSITGLPTDPIELSWTRVVAHTSLTFTNMGFVGTEVPSKITLTFNEAAMVAGTFSINITDGTIGDGTANVIALEGSGLTVSGTSINAWATVLPVSFSSLNVEVKTDKATYTRNISSFTGGAKTFKQNARNTLSINMAEAEREASVQYDWVQKNLSEITDSDVFVIVGNNGSNYALSNDKGTNAAPDAIAVTVSSNKLSVAPADKLQWNLTKDGSNYTFYPNGSTATWLYVYNNNNGLRVGTGTDKVFTLTNDYLYNSGQNRYIGIYNSSDWRSYTSINNNIKDQTFAFYVRTVATPSKPVPTISFNNPTTEVNIGETVTNTATISVQGLTVSYSSSDDAIASVDATTGEVEGIAAGTATITASFAGNDTYGAVSKTYDITVIDPNANDGSAARPYTASEAVDVASASGFTDTDNVYVKGIVCTTGSISSGAVSYYISDDGSSTKRFEAYKGKYISGADFTDGTNLKLGDYVVACGTLTYYSGGSQAEFAQGSEVISVLRAPVFTPDGGSFSTATQSVTITADSGSQIYYTTDESVPTETNGTLYTSAISISASTVIKAIAVKDGVSTGVVSKTFTKSSGGQNVTLQYSGTTTGNFGTDNEAATVGLSATDWSVIASKGSASNNVGYNKDGDIRLYYNAGGSNTLTVSSLNSATINYITITYTGDTYSNGKVLVGGNEVSISSGSYPINSTSFEITNGNTSNVQVRISSIVINYTPAD